MTPLSALYLLPTLATVLGHVLFSGCQGGPPPDVVLAGPASVGYATFWGAWVVALRTALAWRRRRRAADPAVLAGLGAQARGLAGSGLLVAAAVYLTLRYLLLPWMVAVSQACRS